MHQQCIEDLGFSVQFLIFQRSCKKQVNKSCMCCSAWYIKPRLLHCFSLHNLMAHSMFCNTDNPQPPPPSFEQVLKNKTATPLCLTGGPEFFSCWHYFTWVTFQVWPRGTKWIHNNPQWKHPCCTFSVCVCCWRFTNWHMICKGKLQATRQEGTSVMIQNWDTSFAANSSQKMLLW